MPPVVDQSCLWRDESSADVTLLVFPAGDGLCVLPSGKPDPVAKLRLHSTILGSASPAFRAHTQGSWQENRPVAAQEPQPQTQPAAKRLKPAAVEDTPGTVLQLMCFPGEPHTVPEAVMRHAYTRHLPDNAVELAWMVCRAQYLMMHATVSACIAKLALLADGGQLTVQDVVVISSSIPALQPGGSSTAALEQLVGRLASKVLPAQLRQSRQVLLDQQLLRQFVRLPLHLIKDWALMDTLEADSENTIAVLFTAWYDHQLESSAAPTEPQCQELSALVCLSKLTPSFYLQALPHLKWYRAPHSLPGQLATGLAMAQLFNLDTSVHLPALYTTCSGTASRQRGPAIAEQQWCLTRQQVETLWADRNLPLDRRIYFQGFWFCARLKLCCCTDTRRVATCDEDQPGQQDSGNRAGRQCTLGLFVCPRWPSVLVRHGVAAQVASPITVLWASATIGPGPSLGSQFLASADWQRGWKDVARRPFSTAADLANYLMASSEGPTVKLVLSDLVVQRADSGGSGSLAHGLQGLNS